LVSAICEPHRNKLRTKNYGAQSSLPVGIEPHRDAAHEKELRISLPSASFIPQFHRARNGDDSGLPEIDGFATIPLEQIAPIEGRVRPHWLHADALVVVAAGMVVLATRRTSKSS
jgi:hypothetical protein